MNGWRVRFVGGGIALAALLFGIPFASAQTNAAPQILFLRLRVTQADISLVDSSVRPGMVKAQPDPEAKEVQFELVSDAGEVLWQGAMDEPRTRHVEFEEPPRSGQLKRKTIRSNAAEFTVRVPALSQASSINFYSHPAPSADGPSRKPAARKLLGRVPLPPAGQVAP